MAGNGIYNERWINFTVSISELLVRWMSPKLDHFPTSHKFCKSKMNTLRVKEETPKSRKFFKDVKKFKKFSDFLLTFVTSLSDEYFVFQCTAKSELNFHLNTLKTFSTQLCWNFKWNLITFCYKIFLLFSFESLLKVFSTLEALSITKQT